MQFYHYGNIDPIHHDIVNIFFLTEFLSAIGGGGEVVFAENANEMARRGHSVHIICHKSQIDRQGLAKCPNVSIYRIGPQANLHHGYFPSTIQQISYIIRLIIKGRRIIKQNNIDIIHANTLSPSIAGSILSLICGIPVISTFHHVGAVQEKKFSRLASTGILSPRTHWLTRLMVEKFIVYLPLDCVHTVSQTTSSDLRSIGYKGEVAVVPNCLNLARYAEATAIREYLPYVLFVGRLVQSKNLGMVIEAFAGISKAMPHVRFMIAGDGPMRSIWTKRVKELGIGANVRFLGYVSEKTKLDLMSKCSAFVFPSAIEGFGLTILESFAMSKPVLVSDIDSVKELVTDLEDGFIISPSNRSDWERRMKQVLSSKSLCREMGAKGRTKLESTYQIEKAGRSLEAIYYCLAIGREKQSIKSHFITSETA